MLTAELNLFKYWATSGDFPSEVAAGADCFIRQEGDRVKQAWSAAILSSASDESLKRYFNLHLQELTRIINSLKIDTYCIQKEMLALLDHLLEYYVHYLEKETNVPTVYQKRFAYLFLEKVIALKQRFALSAISSDLLQCLIKFLKDMDPSIHENSHTFHSIQYLNKWVDRLSKLNLYHEQAENELHYTLELLNFNDLDYIHLRIATYRNCCISTDDKIKHLQDEKGRLSTLPVTTDSSFQPRWPPLKVMLCGWLSEEVTSALQAQKMTDQKFDLNRTNKYPLNLSVAHLACFLKIFYSTDIPGNRNLTELFEFVTLQFSSKRQGDISAKSLSRLYYNTSQVSAAHVQGLLQQMLSEINRKYFP